MPPVVSPLSANPFSATDLIVRGGREAQAVEFETRVVEFFVGAADLLGVPKSVAAIYGIVFASPEPLTFAEIGERLDISKGSLSQGLRVLREVGALREVSGPSERAGRFEPDLELRKLVAHFLETRLQRQLEQGGARLKQLSQVVPAGDAQTEQILKQRVEAVASWHKNASALLPVARTFLKLST